MGSAASDSVIANPLRASGVLSAADLERARQYQATHGGLLADALLRLKLVEESEFLRVFAELYSAGSLTSKMLRAVRVEPTLVSRVSVKVAERLRMCPLAWDQARAELQLVAAVPLAADLVPEARKLFQAKSVAVHLATPGSVTALIGRAFHRQADAFDEVSSNGAGPDMGSADLLDEDEGDSFELNRLSDPITGSTKTLASAPPAGASASASESDPASAATPEGPTAAELRQEIARYRAVEEIHRRLRLQPTVEAMAEQIATVCLELVPAHGAAVWLPGGTVASRVRAGAPGGMEVLSSVVERALRTTEGVLSLNAQFDAGPGRGPQRTRGTKSVLAVSLRSHQRDPLGVLYLESASGEAAFHEEDLRLLEAMATHAATFLEHAGLLAQVSGESLLSRLLPHDAPKPGGAGPGGLSPDGTIIEAAVLCAQLRQLSPYHSRVNARDVVAQLNRLCAAAADAAARHHGLFARYLGDAVMAVWGVPVGRPDDPRNALTAALELVNWAQRSIPGTAPLQLAVGVHAGPVVMGVIGAGRQRDFAALGESVDWARRLAAHARSSQVLITGDTLLRAGPGVQASAADPLRGSVGDQPLLIYQVTEVEQPVVLSAARPGARAPAPPRRR